MKRVTERTAIRGAALFAVLAMACGCSGNAETPLASLTPSSGTSAGTAAPSSTTENATPSPTGSATASGPVSPLSVKTGYRPGNLTPDQQAVVSAYDAYWVFRAQSLGTNTVDLSRAGTFATAQGIGQITTYVAQQKSRGQHAAGSITTNVTAVTLIGDRATLADCTLDESYDVKTGTGATLSSPPGLAKTTMIIVKGASGWLVANIDPSDAKCTVPSA